MKSQSTNLLFVLFFASAGVAQAPASLLFVPKTPGFTRHTGTTLGIRGLTDTSVAIVQPDGSSCSQTAHKFVTGIAYQTLFGDEDSDGDVFTPNLMGSIQAVLVKPGNWSSTAASFMSRLTPINPREVYITPRVAVGTAVSGNPGLRPCDSGRIVADGQIEYFIRGEQIIAALGMVNGVGVPLMPADVRIDAIAVDVAGTVYLSFEGPHNLQLFVNGLLQFFMVRDGAILMIDSTSLTFDMDGNISAAALNSGRILVTEAAVDNLVMHARSRDNSGACVQACIDVDGLAIDPRGGLFQGSMQTSFSVPHLLFTTQASTGGGVLSTRNNGEIAQVNGCRLAAGCLTAGPTTGNQVGMNATGNVGSLNALATLYKAPSRLMLTSTAADTLNNNCEWAISTDMNIAQVVLYAGNGTLPISPARDIANTLGLTADCFPEFFPDAIAFGPFIVPLTDDGWGGRIATFSIPVPAAIAPNGLITQVFALHGGNLQASNPITFVQ